jgi:prephenate dehydratase
MRVAFQGELGAFSEMAIRQLWPDGVEPVPCREFGDVVQAVIDGTVDAGALPVENLIIGPIETSRAAIAAAGDAVMIVDETVLAIRPLLLALPGVTLADVRRVTSHHAALAQCVAFLAAHPEWVVEPAYDTAGAARDLVARGDRATAVIAGDVAAERYGLSVLARGIADRIDNATSFVVLVKKSPR